MPRHNPRAHTSSARCQVRDQVIGLPSVGTMRRRSRTFPGVRPQSLVQDASRSIIPKYPNHGVENLVVRELVRDGPSDEGPKDHKRDPTQEAEDNSVDQSRKDAAVGGGQRRIDSSFLLRDRAKSKYGHYKEGTQDDQHEEDIRETKTHKVVHHFFQIFGCYLRV